MELNTYSHLRAVSLLHGDTLFNTKHKEETDRLWFRRNR